MVALLMKQKRPLMMIFRVSNLPDMKLKTVKFIKHLKSAQTQKAMLFLNGQDLHIFLPFYCIPDILFIIMSSLLSYKPNNHLHLYAI